MTSGLEAWEGVSEMLLGWKVRSVGAEPGGRVLALKVGAVSLPTRTPGLCWDAGVSGRGEGWVFGGGEGLTPWVVEGSSRGMEGWTSPWALVMESGLREAIFGGVGGWCVWML